MPNAAAFAQTANGSANYVMPGCRSYVQQPSTVDNAQDAFDRGFCLGLVRALVETDNGICPPKGATQAQSMRVVVRYIDNRPTRLRELFIPLTLEALRSAWPCKP
jgi:hypothetical protein